MKVLKKVENRSHTNSYFIFSLFFIFPWNRKQSKSESSEFISLPRVKNNNVIKTHKDIKIKEIHNFPRVGHLLQPQYWAGGWGNRGREAGMVTQVSFWYWICDHHPPPHPHGSTADPHQTLCCITRKGSFLNPSFWAEEHFLHRFQEEKQSTRDVTQGKSCHKASPRSAASRVWLMQKKYLSPAFQ